MNQQLINASHSIQFFMDQAKLFTRFQVSQWRPFLSQVKFEFQVGQYTVKTAENWQELHQALALRYTALVRVYTGARSRIGLDIDDLDFTSDHLLIIHQATQKVVGTYRLRCSLWVERFYAQDEFDLDYALKKPGVKLEVCRATVHPAHRNGQVISLLWQGIAKYMQITDSRYLFGCGSMSDCSSRRINEAIDEIAALGKFDDSLRIHPRSRLLPSHEKEFPVWDDGESTLPSLMRSYLQLGANVASQPYWDQVMNCIDFLMWLDREKMPKQSQRRFFGKVT